MCQVDNVKKKCNENLCGLMTEIRTLELVRLFCSLYLFAIKYKVSVLVNGSEVVRKCHSGTLYRHRLLDYLADLLV